MSSRKCHLYLVRHGETEWNAQGLLQGHSDIHLNDIGLSQALALKEALASVHFSAAFSSDLSRAKKTAEIIISNKETPLTLSKALRERTAGPFEGRPVQELEAWMKQSLTPGKIFSQEEHLSHRWHPNFETSSETYQRIKNFLSSNISYDDSNILVVSHGGVMRSILDHLQYVPGYKWSIANCGYVCLQASEDTFSIKNADGVVFKKV